MSAPDGLAKLRGELLRALERLTRFQTSSGLRNFSRTIWIVNGVEYSKILLNQCDTVI
jgi:hypothetical protein